MTELQDVFMCIEHDRVILSKNKLETCPVCGETLKSTGWFETKTAKHQEQMTEEKE